ncbi:MAG: GNAT family N-acetyltransferase [Candidatus Binatia bacterium]
MSQHNEILPEFLPWDSRFFGIRIARVEGAALGADDFLRLIAWCGRHEIDCLYFLADPAHDDTLRLAEENRFYCVDRRLTLERGMDGDGLSGECPSWIKAFKPGDVGELREIAREAFRDSRFYHDPNFLRERCDALYQRWIENSCERNSNQVWVAHQEERVVGFGTCERLSSGQGNIGLFAVQEGYKDRGIASGLMSASLAWFKKHGFERVSVVTQGRNVPAQRFYQKFGFRRISQKLWYHKWFNQKFDQEN